jgi:hypothetical protein
MKEFDEIELPGGGPCVLGQPEPNYEIVFSADNNWKVKIHTDTGRVEFADGVDIDEASELFWTALAGESPAKLTKEIEELQKQLAPYEEETKRVVDYELAMISMVENPEKGCEFSPELQSALDYGRAMKVVE